ncbi:MAG TPA: hypothetical protein VN782_02860 [Usitatibacter sp.]|nr:hypothetical protein [Usitatibacter sp.]
MTRTSSAPRSENEFGFDVLPRGSHNYKFRSNFKFAVAIVFLWLSITSTGSLADERKPPLTNADVLSLVKAGLPQDTIILTIRSSPSAFDTSPRALIGLKKAGVPASVIDAVLQASSSTRPGDAPAPTAPPSAPASPQEQAAGVIASFWGTKQTKIDVDKVFLIDGNKRIEMKYSRPGTRSRWVFVVQRFAVLNGPTSHLRTSNHSPEFEMILPDNIEPSSIVTLGLLATRPNGSREIMISSAYISATEGLPADRNIPLTYDRAADQRGAPEGYEIYRIKPVNVLQPGEYAFIVNRPGLGGMGGYGPASVEYNFYELGVD